MSSATDNTTTATTDSSHIQPLISKAIPNETENTLSSTLNGMTREETSVENTTTKESTLVSDSTAPAMTDARTDKVAPSTTTSTAVTLERKEALLQEARADRIAWIYRIALPYRVHPPLNFALQESSLETHPSTTNQHSYLKSKAHESAAWNKFQESHVISLVPSAIPLLEHLYGISESHVATLATSTTSNTSQQQQPEQLFHERIQSLLPKHTWEDPRALPTPRQQLQAALHEPDSVHDRTLIKAYQTWLHRLSEPASAVLVQGMRNFCRHFCTSSVDSTHDSTPSHRMVQALRTYLHGTLELVRNHVVWKHKQPTEWTLVQRCLESFIYGQCYEHMALSLWNATEQERQEAWIARVELLQFVTPGHLEVVCLSDKEEGVCETLLHKAIESLRTIDQYYSPMEKLERIRSVYHSVNAGLSAALENATGSTLPSADDVLPTIIWAVLKAKPERIQWNLQLVEDFCPPELMRGEAGYAYTNLYGAVHFILDLDLNEPTSLSISPEDFRKGIESSRKKANEYIHSEMMMKEPVSFRNDYLSSVRIPVSMVREARLRNERVDLEWALEKFERDDSPETVPENGLKRRDSVQVTDDTTDKLPAGFTRSYSFLASNADDLKYSDLPKLLSEYKMLVRATETLISEKVTQSASDRKSKLKETQQALFSRAEQVDPSLLPKTPKSQTATPSKSLTMGGKKSQN
jgi:hypothetical protein